MTSQWKYQNRPYFIAHKWTQINHSKSADVRKCLGICIISCVVPIKNVRLFQKSEVDILTVIGKQCPWIIWEIRKYFHFNDDIQAHSIEHIKSWEAIQIMPCIWGTKIKSLVLHQGKKSWTLVNKCVLWKQVITWTSVSLTVHISMSTNI